MSVLLLHVLFLTNLSAGSIFRHINGFESLEQNDTTFAQVTFTHLCCTNTVHWISYCYSLGKGKQGPPLSLMPWFIVFTLMLCNSFVRGKQKLAPQWPVSVCVWGGGGCESQYDSCGCFPHLLGFVSSSINWRLIHSPARREPIRGTNSLSQQLTACVCGYFFPHGVNCSEQVKPTRDKSPIPQTSVPSSHLSAPARPKASKSTQPIWPASDPS